MRLTMKKLLFILLFPFLTSCQEYITRAIIKSNPELVKKELEKRIATNLPFSVEEQRFYLNFCDEVITRRRNAIQFPRYFDGRPIYTPAFPTDKLASPSSKEIAAFLIGLFGTLVSLPLGISIAENSTSSTDNLVMFTALLSEVGCFSLLCYCLIKRYDDALNFQEQLYENAIEIKHIILNTTTTFKSKNHTD